ncbi:MAG: hypothetical protein GY750_19790 [Lentisphaerae bacterium]|nr:hypothetical protein [Lentisphaerota bacterium]MCP4103638.1 hypothetical protein [Lentisphaerota bacterium]
MWIGFPGNTCGDWRAKVVPAPYFRKTFSLDSVPERSKIKICGLGFYELYINGKKVDVRVLEPVVTHYDKRVRYVEYNVGMFLNQT